MTVWVVKDQADNTVVAAFVTEDEARDMVDMVRERWGTVAADMLWIDELDIYETAESYWQSRWAA